MKLEITPTSIRNANDFIGHYHRHNRPTQGGRFAIGAAYGADLVGVAIVGRPVARLLDDGLTAEVTRLCVLDCAPKNTCSFLYGRCWRIWQQMGGKRMLTYTLQTESGSTLRGAGWKVTGEVRPTKGGWDRENRERAWQPVFGQMKFRWEAQ